MLIIDELREYVFGIFFGEESEKDVVNSDSLKFLGTAFFVSKKGDAITANHVLPEKPLEGNERIYGIMVKSGQTTIYKLVAAARFEASDFSLLRFDLEDCPYFEIDFSEPGIGTDVNAYGYSDHDVHGQGKELRLLKGHMTMPIVSGLGEVSFPIPSGLSGGPVMAGTKCIGFMMGNVTSEKLLTSSEEISEIYNSVEKITLVESKEVLHYGIFRPFSIYKGHESEIFSDKDLPSFITERNQP